VDDDEASGIESPELDCSSYTEDEDSRPESAAKDLGTKPDEPDATTC
jgi:hypothetical protein